MGGRLEQRPLVLWLCRVIVVIISKAQAIKGVRDPLIHAGCQEPSLRLEGSRSKFSVGTAPSAGSLLLIPSGGHRACAHLCTPLRVHVPWPSGGHHDIDNMACQFVSTLCAVSHGPGPIQCLPVSSRRPAPLPTLPGCFQSLLLPAHPFRHSLPLSPSPSSASYMD